VPFVNEGRLDVDGNRHSEQEWYLAVPLKQGEYIEATAEQVDAWVRMAQHQALGRYDSARAFDVLIGAGKAERNEFWISTSIGFREDMRQVALFSTARTSRAS
jgi:hypothetical protein